MTISSIKDMDDLLVKYMLGEATSSEKEAVEQWLSLSGSNKKYYAEMENTWKKSLPESETLSVDTNKAWESLSKKLKTTEPKVIKLPIYQRLLRIAAVLILPLAIAIFVMKNSGKPEVQMVSFKAIAEPQTDTLSDSSTIALNKNSTISYPNHFTGNTREISLKGEAFFHVTPDKKKPFIIHADDVNITVVGTSFNVKQFSNDSTEVIVETGIVKVSDGKDSVQLVKGDRAIYSKNDHSLHKTTTVNKYFNYYFTKTLIFDNTELNEVVKVLNATLDANLVISKEQIKTCRLTATFKNESVKSIVAILEQTLGLTATTQNGQTYLSGNGCN